MPSPSEFKILRDEMAKLIAEVKKRDVHLKEAFHIIEGQKAQISDLSLKVIEQAKLLAYYQNPHSPPSHNSLPSRQRKKENRTDPAQHKKPGRKNGHRGTSHHRRSSKTEHHKLDKCTECGSSNLKETTTTSKQISDIEFIPQCTTTTHVSHNCICGDCNAILEPGPNTKGTSLGPNILIIATEMWDSGASIDSIREMLNMFGVNACKATIQHALYAIGKRLASEADRIRESMSESTYLKIDETPYPIENSTGWIWACIGDDAVSITAARTRAQAVLYEYYPHWNIPITCDGYPGYSPFHIRQRCWSHILRESGDLEHTDQEMQILHQELQQLYHEAKLAPPDIGDAEYDAMIIRAKSIAQVYLDRGSKFGTKLDNAADDLFTFIRYPGMAPTNNESERMIRRAVIHRKMRMRIATAGGMRMFGVLLTCFLSWRKQGQNRAEKLRELLGAT